MKSSKKKKWSAKVTEESNALDLEKGVFKKSDPKEIARSLKASALKSKRRKSSPERSAQSMITFYINRAGKNLSSASKTKLEKARVKLKKL